MNTRIEQLEKQSQIHAARGIKFYLFDPESIAVRKELKVLRLQRIFFQQVFPDRKS